MKEKKELPSMGRALARAENGSPRVATRWWQRRVPRGLLAEFEEPVQLLFRLLRLKTMPAAPVHVVQYM